MIYSHFTLVWCAVEQDLTFCPEIILVQWLLVQLPPEPELRQIGNVLSPRASYLKTRQLSDCVQQFFFSRREQSASSSALQTFHTGCIWTKWVHLCVHTVLSMLKTSYFCLRFSTFYLEMWPCESLKRHIYWPSYFLRAALMFLNQLLLIINCPFIVVHLLV